MGAAAWRTADRPLACNVTNDQQQPPPTTHKPTNHIRRLAQHHPTTRARCCFHPVSDGDYARFLSWPIPACQTIAPASDSRTGNARWASWPACPRRCVPAAWRLRVSASDGLSRPTANGAGWMSYANYERVRVGRIKLQPDRGSRCSDAFFLPSVAVLGLSAEGKPLGAWGMPSGKTWRARVHV